MSLFFHFKRFVGMAVQPLPLVYVFLFAGLALLVWTTRRRLTVACFVCAAFFLVASSLPVWTRATAGMLERRRRPVLEADAAANAPGAIVVLGSGVAHPGDAALPALTRLGDAARARLVEGVRLARLFPEARLVTSGYGMGLEGCADAMAEAAMELGVDGGRIDRLTESLDTAHEARLVRELVGDGKVILVTSAAHMPRAMAYFAQHGVDATPSPCDYLAPYSGATLSAVNRHRWRPKGEHITASEEVWHEAMGLAYRGLFVDEGSRE